MFNLRKLKIKLKNYINNLKNFYYKILIFLIFYQMTFF